MPGRAPQGSPAQPLSPPVYHVLLALGGDVLHGYAIMLRFSELSGGREELLPGSLYATLARMVDGGLIEEARAPRSEESEGPPRRHYRITPKGVAAAQAETERMRRLVAVARKRSWEPHPAR
jgi:DNA-binding PadR family transcriptional regulator